MPKELGYAMFTLWAWVDDKTDENFVPYWEPAMTGHVSSSGIRTGKNDEPWRFSSNKNTVQTLEGLIRTNCMRLRSGNYSCIVINVLK